jgi:hypothetical protein
MNANIKINLKIIKNNFIFDVIYQHGVDVTVCRRYSAPQPLTKLIRIVHILVTKTNWNKKLMTKE